MLPNPMIGLMVTVLALAMPHVAGQTLEYSTYFPGWDNTNRIAVDVAGDIYQTGCENKIPGMKKSVRGAYVAKLTPLGSGLNDLVWITFVAPGSNHTRFLGLTLDGAGKVYAIAKVPAGGQKEDLTVMRFSSTDGQQEISQVIGQGAALAIAFHDAGTERFVYVTGSTEDPLFPTNTGPALDGESDAFVVKYKLIESSSPSLMLATAWVILRVTNSIPLNGDS